MFYDMYVGEVGMTDSCSGIDNFGMSRLLEALGWIYHLVIFFLIDFNLFVIGISSQDVCHILLVCIFIHFFYFLVWKSSNGWGWGWLERDWLVCQYIHFFISGDARMWGNPHEFDCFMGRCDYVVYLVNYLVREGYMYLCSVSAVYVAAGGFRECD